MHEPCVSALFSEQGPNRRFIFMAVSRTRSELLFDIVVNDLKDINDFNDLYMTTNEKTNIVFVGGSSAGAGNKSPERQLRETHTTLIYSPVRATKNTHKYEKLQLKHYGITHDFDATERRNHKDFCLNRIMVAWSYGSLAVLI